MVHVTDWTIAGSDDEPIIGNAHVPDASSFPGARAVVLIAHGFKGYKDYGMFPHITQRMAEHGLIAHRFNFSHSGMTNDIDTFAQPELFERDTWNRQVRDLMAVIVAINHGELPGKGLPLFLFGHSRGGVSCLLTAGRHAADQALHNLRGVISAAAPSTTCNLSDADRERLLAEGRLESPSSRTGQTLYVGRDFLQEQLDHPADHDLLSLAGDIRVPVCVIHGEDDATVPVESAREIAAKVGRPAEIISGGDHVFNTPNPMPDDAQPSRQLQRLVEVMRAFVDEQLGAE